MYFYRMFFKNNVYSIYCKGDPNCGNQQAFTPSSSWYVRTLDNNLSLSLLCPYPSVSSSVSSSVDFYFFLLRSLSLSVSLSLSFTLSLFHSLLLSLIYSLFLLLSLSISITPILGCHLSLLHFFNNLSA